MTIKRAIISFRHYGLAGVCNWIFCHKRNIPEIALANSIKANCRPTPGLTVIGDLSGRSSLCKMLRDLVLSLEQCNIPHQAYDTTKPIPSSFCANRYSDIVSIFQTFKIPGIQNCRQHRIVFWEFDSGFVECHPHCLDGAPLLVFSDFCLKTLQDQIGQHNTVTKVLYPFHFDAKKCPARFETRLKHGIPHDAFAIFFNFDYSSSYLRKNPDGLLHAFAAAFHDNNNAFLVFKTKESESKHLLHEKLKQETKKLNVENQVIFVTDYLSNQELVALTAACDVYASLHRGEGFGLGVAEAMWMGVPVVVSDCGATNEFCKPDTAELIHCKQTTPRQEQIDHPSYKWVKTWPDPNIQDAANALKKLYDNPTYRTELGQRGQKFVKAHFSRENFSNSVAHFLRSTF